jgi:hypothetical protein
LWCKLLAMLLGDRKEGGWRSLTQKFTPCLSAARLGVKQGENRVQ